jgi:surface antigen
VTYGSPSPYVSGDTPPMVYDHSNPPTSAPAPSPADCREYQSQVVIGGRRQTAYGTACRQPDGTWRTTAP